MFTVFHAVLTASNMALTQSSLWWLRLGTKISFYFLFRFVINQEEYLENYVFREDIQILNYALER